MVWGRDNDEKSDVFAPFDLDRKVVDNEKKILAEEKQYGIGGGSDNSIGNGYDDVFADFNLDNIVRDKEESGRRKRESLPQKQQNVVAVEEDSDSGGKKRPRVQFPRIIAVKNEEVNSEGGSSSIQPKPTTLKNAIAGYEKQQKSATSTAITSASLSKSDDDAGKEKKYQKKDSYEGFEIRDSVDKNDDGDDDDHSVEHQTRHLSAVQENDGSEGVLQWESSVPEVENIFADFDLDAIVHDYERLSRKIRGATPDDVKSIDSDEDVTRQYNLCHKCFETVPRVSACFFRVLLPLWLLVLLAIGLGYVLGRFEEEDEYERNDEAMRNRFLVESFPLDELLPVASAVPAECVDTFIETRFNIKLSQNKSLAPDNNLEELLGSDVIFPNVDDLDPSDNSTILEDLLSSMGPCIEFGTYLVDEIGGFMIERSKGIQDLSFSLTFDFIRCWNTTELGPVNPMRGTQATIEAARNQDEFYSENWRTSQRQLLESYLNEGTCSTSECCRVAFQESVIDATGRSGCNVNIGNSAWLWFMVLTTVGWGNTVPYTEQGRILIACFGWISIIAFGGLIAVAGRVIGIIIDDLFRKMHLKWLSSNLGGVILWGTLSISWMSFMAEYTLNWWQGRLGDDPPDRNDAYWFSYISLLTVGFGDYYLESEFIFMNDLFNFAFIFLAGFSFLSSFLDKVASLCSGFFPQAGSLLEEKLRNTELVGLKSIKYKEKNEKALDDLIGIVSKMDDDSVNSIEKRAGRIRQKKEILIHLLYQTEQELDHFKKRGEKYDLPSISQVTREENMLLEILDKTTKEREAVERYRKRGKSIEKDDNFDLLVN